MAKKTQGQQVQAEQPNQAEQKMPVEPQAGERTRSGRTFRPRVDIRETDLGLMLLADVPGAKPDAPEGYSPIYQEYQIGDFECDFTLSGDFDADRIEASLTNGVLRLTVPRAEQAEARTIKIKAGD